MKTDRYSHMSDTALLECYYGDKDQEWMGILLERYTLLLLGVCMKYLKNEEEAKDAVQQIFLKVLLEVGKYRIDYFKAWLHMVAKNHCLMKLRNHHARNTKDISTQVGLTSEEHNHHQFLQNERTYMLLEQTLAELSPEQKQCVILFYLHKKSYIQIAELTGYSLLQVKSYIQNGKRNLKCMLEKKLKATGVKE